jgi:hypothetical protein
MSEHHSKPDDQRALLAQFHQTTSEQLNARLSESPKFFGLLIIVSTGYGYVLSNEKLRCDGTLLIAASFLSYAAVLWAIWYLAALGYAFRFLQNIQHCIEHKLGWHNYTPGPENKRRTGQPPKPRETFMDRFWLLPGIYHAHAAGLAVFLLIICCVFPFRAWAIWTPSWERSIVVVISGLAFIAGLALTCSANAHYVDKYAAKWTDPTAVSVSTGATSG